MKSYTITVNGNVYDVTVEEKGGVTSGSSTGTSGSTCNGTGSTGSTGTGCKIQQEQESVQVKAGAARQGI